MHVLTSLTDSKGASIVTNCILLLTASEAKMTALSAESEALAASLEKAEASPMVMMAPKLASQNKSKRQNKEL
jgi:outer membrane murein-binding lipoprotein Lpp